ELIICDSGSVDGTEGICRKYADRDVRVRYYRSERNHGAARNFNWTFDFALADYFKWVAHGDVLAPVYLEACVAALEAAPDAVLCRSRVGVIDGQGRRHAGIDGPPAGLDAGRPAARFAAAVRARDTAREVFGVARASALIGSRLHGGFPACERALAAELALRGRFVEIPACLSFSRDRRARGYGRSAAADADGAAAAWHDPADGRRVTLPLWRLYAEYVRVVRRQLTNVGPRLRCYLCLARSLAFDRNGVRLARELAGFVGPRLGGLVVGLKGRLFGPAVPSLAGGGKPGGSAP
ncbi:MAG TPA: glycosyltransferase family 2 protein, partial [Geminicoccaceae bacterium]|nr:glycosyltransferase family 2 protein [Geminicoccaceae bacterium]